MKWYTILARSACILMIGISALGAFVVGALFLLNTFGLFQDPKVDVVPRIEDECVVFDISYSGITSITDFRVEDEATGKLLWRVELWWHVSQSKEKSRQIKYGVLPPGDEESEQLHPPENQSPIDIRNKTVTVTVEYNFANFGEFYGTFRKTMKIH